MRIHRGDVLKCSVDPNCSYTTPKKSLMTAHERAHKKERLFKCNLCDKAFVENSALTRHKRIHSDELPFACNVCPFKTRRRDKLKHHLKKKHPQINAHFYASGFILETEFLCKKSQHISSNIVFNPQIQIIYEDEDAGWCWQKVVCGFGFHLFRIYLEFIF